MKDTAGLLEANHEFYRAFRERDLAAMDRVWAKEHLVACVHPGWEPLTGRGAVMESWRAILAAETSPPVRSADEAILSMGPGSAVVICAELIDDVRLVATNVFSVEGGGWRLVHHHASPLSRLRPRPPTPRGLN